LVARIATRILAYTLSILTAGWLLQDPA